MRLVRFGPDGEERPGVLVEDRILDLSPRIDDIGPVTIASIGELADAASSDVLDTVAIANTRLGSPIARPGKILGIGLNYADHAREAGMEIPAEPIVFTKATTALCGAFDDLLLPPLAESVDWEVELGVVIGRTCRYLEDEAAAGGAIAGYVVANDVSDRAAQLERGGQWVKGKSADSFCPVGPWLVTADEIEDPLALRLGCLVNGEDRQDGSTATMIFSPRDIVRHLSRFMTLEPGDLILTGTPPGVGMGKGTYLREGDVVEPWIEGLGRPRQVCRRVEVSPM